eukprot:gene11702-34430_t
MIDIAVALLVALLVAELDFPVAEIDFKVFNWFGTDAAPKHSRKKAYKKPQRSLWTKLTSCFRSQREANLSPPPQAAPKYPCPAPAPPSTTSTQTAMTTLSRGPLTCTRGLPAGYISLSTRSLTCTRYLLAAEATSHDMCLTVQAGPKPSEGDIIYIDCTKHPPAT